MFREATEILSELRPKREEGLTLLVKASNLGNLRAKALIGWESLFGADMLQNITLAKETFTELAAHGIPEAHMVIEVLRYFSSFHYHYVTSILNVSGIRIFIRYRYWCGTKSI